MFDDVTSPWALAPEMFVVPGTCVKTGGPAAGRRETPAREPRRPRDPVLRNHYLQAALAGIPRLLSAIDRNPYRPTYGCLDRQYWHYRTAAFPSGMYQEGALAMAMAYAWELPGNRWAGSPRVRELAEAAVRFAAAVSHADGSCDDYYPFERALGAAVFSLQAAARAYALLRLDDRELVTWLARRADWIAGHDETGRLANHQALAALALFYVAKITGEERHRRAAEARLARVLSWQSHEGWFEEYGGADPGYQTVTIDCLAKIRRLTGETALDGPIRRAVEFARWFLHPDSSYGGEYGSRGTYHFYPHGFELLAGEDPNAADLADGFLEALAMGLEACFDDDRLMAHRLGNLLDAYVDWAPMRPAPRGPAASPAVRYFPQARLLVRRTCGEKGTRYILPERPERCFAQNIPGPFFGHTIVSGARGGVWKHFRCQCDVLGDAGLVVELADGRVAVSQLHDLGRDVTYNPASPPGGATLTVSGPLYFACFETATPVKQALFHAGMVTVGRWCHDAVRGLLQRRLITGRRPAPVRLTRRIELLGPPAAPGGPALRVTDTIELTERRARVRRMSFGTDHQAAYVAAANVYQQSVLRPWHSLDRYVGALNHEGRVTVVREF